MAAASAAFYPVCRSAPDRFTPFASIPAFPPTHGHRPARRGNAEECVGTLHDVLHGRRWGCVPWQANQTRPNPVVVVRVENPNGLEVPRLDRALELATETYDRAGVTVRWAPEQNTVPDRTLTVVLTMSTACRPGLGARCDGRGTRPWRRHARDAGVCLPRQGHVVCRLLPPRCRARARLRPVARDRPPAAATQRAPARQRYARRLASGALSAASTRNPGIPSRSGEAAAASRAASVSRTAS